MQKIKIAYVRLYSGCIPIVFRLYSDFFHHLLFLLILSNIPFVSCTIFDFPCKLPPPDPFHDSRTTLGLQLGQSVVKYVLTIQTSFIIIFVKKIKEVESKSY